ncbi:hypothetical protein [uncultured Methylobacterium sp.]|uniref:hypothetical protein n=1 Tax=uncultured Methylobacterium sp. TaxID=157278 RepID=UPI0035CCA373
MRLVLLAVLAAAPALAQQPARPSQKPALTVQGPASVLVIGCPSLANYRLLRRETPDQAAAAARLADPKADHLGCVAIGRDRVSALSDHVALGGQAYDCVALQGTAICHWTSAGTVIPTEAARMPPAKPQASDKGRR